MGGSKIFGVDGSVMNGSGKFVLDGSGTDGSAFL